MLKCCKRGRVTVVKKSTVFLCFAFDEGFTVVSLLSCMRTGTGGNQTAIFSQVKTALWWCGTMAAAGATCPATITWLTPARKAPVSSRVCFWASRFPLSRGLESSTASCGPPPKVRNAGIFGRLRQSYETGAIVRYGCALGYQQRLNPLIRCLSKGRWERPQIICIRGEFRVLSL